MESWQFLIQREGDRGWKPIRTGNLQLKEGKYRIVANSNLINTQIHTRVTYQNLGTKIPERKSQARNQTTNARGLVVITPFTNLYPGLWQFVCSGEATDKPAWHQILKLRVLPRNQAKPPIQPVITTTTFLPPQDISDDVAAPTEPLIPIKIVGEQDNWAQGLDRLLEQLEQDSLKPRQPIIIDSVPNLLQITPIIDPPSRLINLERSTFSGVIPGNRLSINGSCNLQLFSADLVQKVQISKLLICLRHPQTAAIVVSIEQPIPQNVEMFAFTGQIQLPIETTTSLLMGEVNLYDRHNIQLGTTGFTVTIDLDPIHESELSFLELLDSQDEDEDADLILARLAQELQLETASPQPQFQTFSAPTPPPPAPQNLTSTPYPSVPTAYQRESLLDRQPQITPVEPSATNFKPKFDRSSPLGTPDITGDLDLDFDPPPIEQPPRDRQLDNLEVVVD
jgi:hypothetical protein